MTRLPQRAPVIDASGVSVSCSGTDIQFGQFIWFSSHISQGRLSTLDDRIRAIKQAPTSLVLNQQPVS